jgi:hypothetical protein
MGLSLNILFVAIASLLLASVRADQALQFSLAPRSKQCFFEDVQAGSRKVLEILVLIGPDFEATLDMYEGLSLEQIKEGELGSPSSTEFISLDTTDADSFITTLSPEKDTTYGLCVRHSDMFIPKEIRFNIFQPPTARDRQREQDNDVKDLERAKEEDQKGLGYRADRILRRLEKVENQLARDKGRLNMHSTTNLSSHKRVVVSSLAETVIFVLASVFQLYFIKRWFLSKRDSQETWV